MRSPGRASLMAVLTCFNRKPMTLACLASLEEAAARAGVDVSAIVVDDASTDGTAAAVRRAFDWVDVIAGTGALFWNRGMHVGFGRALQHRVDDYLWLNDDTVLLPDALQRLLQQADALRDAEGRAPILVGATVDECGRMSYGGAVAHSRFRRFSYRPVWSEREPLRCDVMNGNCVLLPREVAVRVGNVDPAFEHAMGDTDYALRARRAGHAIYVAAGVVGRCANNPTRDTFHDRSLPLGVRWRMMMSRKGLPVRSWLRFTRRHGGPAWPLYFIWPYAKLIATGWRAAVPAAAAKQSAKPSTIKAP